MARTTDDTSPFAIEKKEREQSWEMKLDPTLAKREQEHQAVSREALQSTMAPFVMKMLT